MKKKIFVLLIAFLLIFSLIKIPIAKGEINNFSISPDSGIYFTFVNFAFVNFFI